MAAGMTKNETEIAYAREFAMALPALPGDAALRERRKRAFAQFEAQGLPSRRNEEWHYTDYRARLSPPVMQAYSPLALSGKLPLDPLAASGAAAHYRLVNGAFASDRPLPKGVEIYPLARALRERPDLVARIGEVFADTLSPMAALNTAFFADTLFVVVGKGVKLDAPLHASFYFGGDMPLRLVARGFIIVEDGAEATLVNSVTGSEGVGYQSNSIVEIWVGDNAKVQYVRNNGTGLASTAVHMIGARIGARSEVNIFNMTTGAGLSRHEIRLAFAGPNAKAGIRGVGMLRGAQHSDTTLIVDHAAPGCESRELFRHIVDDSATGVFQGKISVRQVAQKTDGQMASNAILLSDEATMNNKPELEIFADDVVCAHGATCGALDDDLLFYLQARGLPRKEAEALMIQAFCGEAIEFVEDDVLRAALNGVVADWLAARAAA